MKQLVGPHEIEGKTAIGAKIYGDSVAVHFSDNTALGFFTENGGICVLRYLNPKDRLNIEGLGLRTQADVEEEQAKEKESRRLQFLQLKAEFEPGAAG